MRARKRFGQHFLHDPAVIARIVAAVAPTPAQCLVEIGPGRGALTATLLAAATRLDAIEIDRDLAAALRVRYPAGEGLTLHEADVLQFDWPALAAARAQPLRLVGNLPYNISTPLLFGLLAHRDMISDMHFMLQKEVVDRIVAIPDSEHYGRLSVMLAPFVRPQRLFDVGPGAFAPPPAVWSAVVRLAVNQSAPVWAGTPRFAQIVTAAFGQRRKTLRNALRTLLSAHDIARAGIDPGARAETLSAEQFGVLAQIQATVIH